MLAMVMEPREWVEGGREVGGECRVYSFRPFFEALAYLIGTRIDESRYG